MRLLPFFSSWSRTRTLVYAFLLLTATRVNAGFIDPFGPGTELSDILETIVNVVIFIAFPLIVLMLVYTGFLFVQAQGNPAKLAEARKVFIWTLIGAFVILAAETLKDVVVDTVQEIRQ